MDARGTTVKEKVGQLWLRYPKSAFAVAFLCGATLIAGFYEPDKKLQDKLASRDKKIAKLESSNEELQSFNESLTKDAKKTKERVNELETELRSAESRLVAFQKTPAQPVVAVEQKVASSDWPEVKHLLADGNGHDWIKLSDRERLRLCMEIEKATEAKHSAYDYSEFLGTFYGNAQRDGNSQLLDRSISETAAVGAATMDKTP